MEPPRILLIDDDPEVQRIVKKSSNPLIILDYSDSFAKAIELIKRHKYALYLVDIFLGEENGMDWVEFHQHSGVVDLERIIVMTSSQEVENEIRGNQLGVRDFIRKPFNTSLLRSILDKHLSYLLKSPINIVQEGPFYLDLIKHEAYILENGEKRKLELTHKEFQILRLLVEKKNQIFSRDIIFDRLWDGSNSMLRTVDMHISSLKKKIAPYSNMIRNKRSVGYYFEFI